MVVAQRLWPALADAAAPGITACTRFAMVAMPAINILPTMLWPILGVKRNPNPVPDV